MDAHTADQQRTVFALKRSPLKSPSTRARGSSSDHSGHTGMWDIWTLHSFSEKHKERKLLRNPSEHGAHPKREPLALFPGPKRGDAWVWRSTRVSTEDPGPQSRPSPTSPGGDAPRHGLRRILSPSQSSGWRAGETHSPGAGSSPQKMPPSALQSRSTRTWRPHLARGGHTLPHLLKAPPKAPTYAARTG